MKTTLEGKDLLLHRLNGLRQIPTISAALVPLLDYLDQPVDRLEVDKVADFLARDKSLAAQCLQMANSPLFGRTREIESLRGAVVSLGIHRISEIAMSCAVLNMLPEDKTSPDPLVFWEHSLGCALVCRHLARSFDLPDPEKAYLAGLLHDLGIIVNLRLLPQEFRQAFEIAEAQGIPLHEAEQLTLGFTHCESGRLLAERWGLAPGVIDVVAHHHSPEKSSQHAELVALVHVADLLCRMSSLNHGYKEERQVNLSEDGGFELLARKSPSLSRFDWCRLTFELDSYMDEVHALVRTIYRP